MTTLAEFRSKLSNKNSIDRKLNKFNTELGDYLPDFRKYMATQMPSVAAPDLSTDLTSLDDAELANLSHVNAAWESFYETSFGAYQASEEIMKQELQEEKYYLYEVMSEEPSFTKSTKDLKDAIVAGDDGIKAIAHKHRDYRAGSHVLKARYESHKKLSIRIAVERKRRRPDGVPWNSERDEY